MSTRAFLLLWTLSYQLFRVNLQNTANMGWYLLHQTDNIVFIWSFHKIEEFLKSQVVDSSHVPGLDHSYFVVPSGVQLDVCSGAVLQSAADTDWDCRVSHLPPLPLSMWLSQCLSVIRRNTNLQTTTKSLLNLTFNIQHFILNQRSLARLWPHSILSLLMAARPSLQNYKTM